jgi:hypothetical protein
MAKNGKMGNAKMPQERFERSAPQAPVCGEKYGTEMGNPESLDRMRSGLSNYVKKHKMKYE